MNLHELQREVYCWTKRNFGEGDPTEPLLGVVEEVGELSHHHLKEQQGIRMQEDHVAEAKDAIGDIVIYLADYCNKRGFDMHQIVKETWAKVSQRDWKKNPDTAHETSSS